MLILFTLRKVFERSEIKFGMKGLIHTETRNVMLPVLGININFYPNIILYLKRS